MPVPCSLPGGQLVARALRASWSEAQLFAFAKGVRLDVKVLRRQLMAIHPGDRVTAAAE